MILVNNPSAVTITDVTITVATATDATQVDTQSETTATLSVDATSTTGSGTVGGISTGFLVSIIVAVIVLFGGTRFWNKAKKRVSETERNRLS